jgi:two-component system phosphate regulon sensor histidine kinase PhoR
VQPAAGAKKITILNEVDEVTVSAHALGLTELVTILLDNAIKYSHDEGKIILRAHKNGKGAILEVEDFGVGIKSSDLPYIFNRFYRAEASRSKRQVDGYGLGLSIAKNIVDLHHGKLMVESTPDKGSTFTVTM